ncbi:MAG: response regulator, partial [Pseudomonadota bacterium]|nr:response regulator [Pseudomonadota bacterium]
RGVGLGLAIVERISRLLKVEVQVRSRLGRGSVFSVRVPLARQPLATQQRNSLGAHLAVPLQGRRLLVIDNEQMVLQSMQGLLQQWGADVLTAADLEQALSCLQGRAPDLALVDYHLDGGRTGLEALAALREQFGPGLPALMITADRTEDCRQGARALGVAVLNKPIKAGKLRASLDTLLTPCR